MTQPAAICKLQFPLPGKDAASPAAAVSAPFFSTVRHYVCSGLTGRAAYTRRAPASGIEPEDDSGSRLVRLFGSLNTAALFPHFSISAFQRFSVCA
jgi:hypothetical protein